MSAKKHLWFCIGSPTDGLLTGKRYRDVETADYILSDSDRVHDFMFIFKDDELVWVHDFREVYSEWVRDRGYSPAGMQVNIYLHQKFCEDFQRWAVSVWGR